MSVEDIQNKLNILKKGYLKKMETNVVELKAMAQKFEADNVNKVYMIVHTTSGTSGMYGLSQLSELSTEFELYLKEIRNDMSLIKEEEFMAKLNTYIVEVEKMISED